MPAILPLRFSGGENDDLSSALTPNSQGVLDYLLECRDAVITFGATTLSARPRAWWPREKSTGLHLPYPHLMLKRFWDGSRWRHFCATSAITSVPPGEDAALHEIYIPNESDGVSYQAISEKVVNHDTAKALPIPIYDDMFLDGINYMGDIYIINGGKPESPDVSQAKYHTCPRCTIWIPKGSDYGIPLPWVDTGDLSGKDDEPRQEWGNYRFPSCRTAWVTSAYVIAGGLWGLPLMGDENGGPSVPWTLDAEMANHMIMWSNANGPNMWSSKWYFPVFPDDDDVITKGIAFQDRAIVWKNKHMYGLAPNVPPFTDCFRIADHGCPFPETVQRWEGGVAYLNDWLDPMYWNGEGYPVKLCDPNKTEYMHKRKAAWFSGYSKLNDNNTTALILYEVSETNPKGYAPDAETSPEAPVLFPAPADPVGPDAEFDEARSQFTMLSGFNGHSAPSTAYPTRVQVLMAVSDIGRYVVECAFYKEMGSVVPEFSCNAPLIEDVAREYKEDPEHPKLYRWVYTYKEVVFDAFQAHSVPNLLQGNATWWVGLRVRTPGGVSVKFQLMVVTPDGWYMAKPSGNGYVMLHNCAVCGLQGNGFMGKNMATAQHGIVGTPVFKVEGDLSRWGTVNFDAYIPNGASIELHLFGSHDGVGNWNEVILHKGDVISLQNDTVYIYWSMTFIRDPDSGSVPVLFTKPSISYFTVSGGYSVKRIPTAAVIDGRYVLATCGPTSDHNDEALIIQPEEAKAPGSVARAQGNRALPVRWSIAANHLCIFTIDRCQTIDGSDVKWCEDYLAWSGLDPSQAYFGGGVEKGYIPPSELNDDCLMMLGRQQVNDDYPEMFRGGTVWVKSGRRNVDFRLKTHRIPLDAGTGDPSSAFIKSMQFSGTAGADGNGVKQNIRITLIGDRGQPGPGQINSLGDRIQKVRELLDYLDDGAIIDIRVGLDARSVQLVIEPLGEVSDAVMAYIRQIALVLEPHGRPYRG